ncbi:hypothetical protein DFH06DRAFT_1097138 [Mycena polygramma]|nr:hypothetical protein DFH06DRAFT_1097138 [Mycena polygramma]
MSTVDVADEALEVALRSTPTPNPEPRRVEELWFPDGTLVLTTETALFRVYGGLLAKESPIFHDMLQMPQPTERPTLDNCPVVDLPDNGRDVEFFLKALFDYKFFLPLPNPTNFDVLTSVLRLSKKYDVGPLHKRALAHLASGFPLVKTGYPPSSSWETAGQHIRAVVFAREMQLDWILPLAFYRVCLHSVDKIMNGVDVDGVRIELNPKDKRACLEQSILLRGPASAEILNFLWEPDIIPSCSRAQECRLSRIARRKVAEGWRGSHLPLTLWEDSDWGALDVCFACLIAMKEAHKTALNNFWDGLPQRFGVDGWDVLKEMKKSLLGS